MKVKRKSFFFIDKFLFFLLSINKGRKETKPDEILILMVRYYIDGV